MRNWLLTMVLGVAGSTMAMAGAEVPVDAASLHGFAGTYETDRLLALPGVDAGLRRVAGDQLAHLRRNLDVSGAIDMTAGWLAVSGNAPHQGTEEEAIVCVRGDGGAVEAAILSGPDIMVLTTATDYGELPLCIKDWITLANSRHRDRLIRPANVRLIRSGQWETD